MESNKKTIVIVIIALLIGFLGGSMIGKSRHYNMERDHMRDKDMKRSDMMNHSMMSGTTSAMQHQMDQMMVGLEGKTNADFDKAFLEGMIVHHQGAVLMAEAVLKQSKRPELTKMANDIITVQTAEIKQMEAWLSEWFK